MMKKLAISVAVAAAMGMTAANAATVSEYDEGVLVPHVVHNGDDDTTAVGLISRSKGTVYWAFLDVDSNHVIDSQFDVTANDMYSFIWSKESNGAFAGEEGYLVFVLDTNKDSQLTSGSSGDTPNQLAGAAFQVKTGSNDVAFVPTMPLDISDFGGGVSNLTAMGVGTLVNLQAGISDTCNADYDVDMRYFIDGQDGGDDTKIVIWSAQDIKGTYVIQGFDADQNRRSMNLVLDNKELNIIDPEKDIPGLTFTDGFLRWDVPCGKDASGNTAPSNGVLTYSEISSQSFGAVQTIVNPFGTNVTP